MRYKYYSRKLLQFISKTNPKNIRLFMRKKAPFSGFRNGEWKLKKGYPFSSFECEIQRNTLIFRHFSFSSSAFFAKSRIARSDHWFKCYANTFVKVDAQIEEDCRQTISYLKGYSYLKLYCKKQSNQKPTANIVSTTRRTTLCWVRGNIKELLFIKLTL